jgi:hypothetical protein
MHVRDVFSFVHCHPYTDKKNVESKNTRTFCVCVGEGGVGGAVGFPGPLRLPLGREHISVFQLAELPLLVQDVS